MPFDNNQLKFMLEAIKYPGITGAFIFGTGFLLILLPFLPFMKKNILNLVIFALGCTLIIAASKIFGFSTHGIAPEIGFRDLVLVAAFSGAGLVILAKNEKVKGNKKLLMAVGLLLVTASLCLLYLLSPVSQQPASAKKQLNILGSIAIVIGLWLMEADTFIQGKRLALVGGILILVGDFLAFVLFSY